MIDQYFGGLLDFAIFIGIIIATLVLSWLFRRFYNRLILSSKLTHSDNPTHYKFLKHVVSGLIIIVGFGLAIWRVDSFKAIAGTLLTTAGILAVVIGFASQAALSNIISGIFIVIFKPFRVNDRVQIRDTLMGTVEDITLRHTVIRDFQNRRIFIPNAIISDEVVTNFDIEDEKICRWVDFGISYDSDIDLARKIIQEESLNHPFQIDNRTPEDIEVGREEVPVRLMSLGDFSVNLRAWVWANNQQDSFIMEREIMESVKKRFDKEGIEIPFPYRTLVFKDRSLFKDKPAGDNPDHK